MNYSDQFRVASRARIGFFGYGALNELVIPIAREFADRAEILVFDDILDKAVKRARELFEHEHADVVISGGANAAILRSALSVPVIPIRVTGFDVLQALFKARHISERIGIVSYQSPIGELEEMKSLLNVDLRQEVYFTLNDARAAIRMLTADGYRVIVGSSLVIDLAQQVGCTAFLVYTHTAIRRAFDEAIDAARAAQLTRGQRDQLNAIIQHLQEGVIAVDMKERITAINPAMESFIGVNRAWVIGKPLSSVAEIGLSDVLLTGEGETNQIYTIAKRTFAINRIPLKEGNVQTGALLTMKDASALQQVDHKLRANGLSAKYSFSDLIGRSEALIHAKEIAKRYARTNATVLITGESGTGKEGFAHAIHNASPRAAGPFVAINCAALPESLLESELFGYEEGAFTGSRKGGKAGLLEIANGGTIFLDEIGDMPFALQTRLLRVLQDREVWRLGASRPGRVDVRVIAATNQPLKTRVAEQRFREDLYYRLNILRLHLPALRERPEDIPELALKLLHAALRRLGSSLPADQILAPALPDLRAYEWPGNVRELESVVERLAILLSDYLSVNQIDYDRVYRDIPEFASASPAAPTLEGATVAGTIEEALERHGGNRSAAARELGISRTTLWRRLRHEAHTPPSSGDN